MIDVTGLPVWGGLPAAGAAEAAVVVAGIPIADAIGASSPLGIHR